MRSKENYIRHIVVTFALSMGILLLFQANYYANRGALPKTKNGMNSSP
ncbi:MAG: hypothetical protein WA996_24155 [Candidatus Promineifilaceae bacterium]